MYYTFTNDLILGNTIFNKNKKTFGFAKRPWRKEKVIYWIGQRSLWLYSWRWLQQWGKV